MERIIASVTAHSKEEALAALDILEEHIKRSVYDDQYVVEKVVYTNEGRITLNDHVRPAQNTFHIMRGNS